MQINPDKWILIKYIIIISTLLILSVIIDHYHYLSEYFVKYEFLAGYHYNFEKYIFSVVIDEIWGVCKNARSHEIPVSTST